MLKDCLAVFKMQLEEKSIKWVLDNYIPKDGTYVLIDMDDEFRLKDVFDIKKDKKSGEPEGQNNSNYELVSYLDYYSKLVEMNKPIDSKKIIHSNNMYSLFVKKESIQQKKLTADIIDGYYAILSDPLKKYAKSRQAVEIYNQVEEENGIVDQEQVEQIHNWVSANLTSFLEENQIDTGKKDYLKLFFVYDNEEKTRKRIKEEGERYLFPNIFNNNDFNVRDDNGIWGLPSNNMGMNAKKPYLENKSRKTKVPYLIMNEEALLQMQFFDYLSGQVARGINDIYIDMDENSIKPLKAGEKMPDMLSAVYLRIQQGKELEIHHVDSITAYHTALDRPFTMRNIIPVTDPMMEKVTQLYGIRTDLWEIENLTDEIFFGKKLKYNYFTKPEDITFKDRLLENVLLTYRESLWNWFRKGESAGMKGIIDKMALRLIMDSIAKEHLTKANTQMNLWIAIADYLGDNRRMEETMSESRENLKKHILSKEEWDFTSDEEYYYAVGQAVRVFYYRSRAANKNMSFINPFLDAKNDQIVKERLKIMLRKYGYDITEKDGRIKKLLGHVFDYDQAGKVDSSKIIAGFVDFTLLYEKGDKTDAKEAINKEND